MKCREVREILLLSHHHARLVGRRPDVVDLEDHLDELARQQDLRFLAVQALDHVLLLHVEVPGAHAVNAECGVLFRHLQWNKLRSLQNLVLSLTDFFLEMCRSQF